MKIFRYTAVLLFLVLPSLALAQSVPAFPMAFWGNVTINGSPAPVGTVVNAYYGSTLAGTVTVQDAGVYGYTDPTQQKLVIGEGIGPISFTIVSPQFNSGAETGGTNQPTYAQFTSGATVENDLTFTVAVPSSSSGSTPVTTTSSGGGGGITYSYGLTINGGATTTTSTSVTLTITPAGDANQMWISNTSSFSSGSWIPFQSTYPWTLASGIGIQTVYLRYGSASSTVANAQTSIQFTGAVGGTPITTSVAPVTTSTATTGQVLGASAYNFTRLLKRGLSGQDVMQLQQILIAAGFLKIDAPTTYFGAQTEAALKAYQTAHGLDAVGYTGPKTRALLNQGTLPTTPETASSTAMTGAQKQTLIATLEAQLQTLLAEITALSASTTQTQ